MEEVATKVKNIFKNGKTYFKKERIFKDKHSFSQRQEEAIKIRKKYPDRVPVICERAGDDIPDIDRKKYLVPEDLTMAQFLFIIRKRIKINPEQSIYLFVNNSVIVAGSQLIGSIYDKYKDLDGFLYTCYSGENTFG